MGPQPVGAGAGSCGWSRSATSSGRWCRSFIAVTVLVQRRQGPDDLAGLLHQPVVHAGRQLRRRGRRAPFGAEPELQAVGARAVLIAVPLGVAFAIALDRWRGRTAPARELRDALLVHHPRDRDRRRPVPDGHPAGRRRSGSGSRRRCSACRCSRWPTPSSSCARASCRSARVRGSRDGPGRIADPGAMRRVLLPLLSPAIFASAAIVFASAIDNFAILQRLCAARVVADDPFFIYSARPGVHRSPRSTRWRASRSSPRP